MVKFLPGDLKKEIMNKRTTMELKKMIQANTGIDALKKKKKTRFINPKINALIAIDLYPSL